MSYFYPFQSHLKRLRIPELQIFGRNVTGSMNKKDERQIIEHHGSSPFLKLEKKICKENSCSLFLQRETDDICC